MAQGRVSIPSSSGHQFTAPDATRGWGTSILVSIPSSSGHQFTDSPFGISAQTAQKFQSLLHQGISLLEVVAKGRPYAALGFQSLLHQGISLLNPRVVMLDTFNASSFNPFFIRASVYCAPKGTFPSRLLGSVSIPSSSGHQFTAFHRRVRRGAWHRGFNPFFIRASVYWTPPWLPTREPKCVSIPSSSGHQFTGRVMLHSARDVAAVSIPSSSGHQFTAENGLRVPIDDDYVSIPSSSGHQFTGRNVAGAVIVVVLQFQSLLHQGISLLPSGADGRRAG